MFRGRELEAGVGPDHHHIAVHRLVHRKDQRIQVRVHPEAPNLVGAKQAMQSSLLSCCRVGTVSASLMAELLSVTRCKSVVRN